MISALICVLFRLVSLITVGGVTLLALMDGTASGGSSVDMGQTVTAVGLRDPQWTPSEMLLEFYSIVIAALSRASTWLCVASGGWLAHFVDSNAVSGSHSQHLRQLGLGSCRWGKRQLAVGDGRGPVTLAGLDFGDALI